MLQTAPLPDTIADLLGIDGTLGAVVGGLVGAALVGTLMLTMTAVAGPWAKRKITAAFTDRYAVNRVGPAGLLIIVADAVRLLSKELIVPEGVDRPAWDVAPLLLAWSALLGFAVIPMEATANTYTRPISGSARWMPLPIGMTAKPRSADHASRSGAMSQAGRSTPSGTMSSFDSRRTASAAMMSRPAGPTRLTA